MIPLALRASTSVRTASGVPLQIHAMTKNRSFLDCVDIDALLARTSTVLETSVHPVQRDTLAVSPGHWLGTFIVCNIAPFNVPAIVPYFL